MSGAAPLRCSPLACDRTLCATYQFNEVQWESPLPYFIKDDANEIHILISGDPAKVLPKALAECFGASPLTIQGMLSAQTGEKLNNMLVEMGMETLPESEGLQGAARSGIGSCAPLALRRLLCPWRTAFFMKEL